MEVIEKRIDVANHPTKAASATTC